MLKDYKLSLLIALVIWVVCLIPVPETPLDNVRFIDKWTHFVMYGTLTFAIWWEYCRSHKRTFNTTNATTAPEASPQHSPFSWFRLSLIGIVLPIIMGCLVEVAQATLTTCRSGDVFDAICNALGVLLAAIISAIAVKVMRL